MKTIGLIGGITPQSTILYYQILNDLAEEHTGTSHSAKCLINSVDFGQIKKLQHEGCWDLLDEIMADAAKNLENAGASLVLITANTMHLTIEAVRKSVSVPVIHIAEATAEKIVEKNLKTVLLLGTKYTMEMDFYKDVLSSFGINSLIPNAEERKEINRVIYEELPKGELKESSRANYVQIIERLKNEEGAEGVILGCTEIPLLIQQKDVSIPVFDTTKIHATKAMYLAMN
ncbi:aspartate/glutamate racemase family protein [Kordia sp.]|uniref:aspartate/glutamate racemase family protein n=1 Tax=Kordia sp. TaxID=1965332 RepID=UPI0025BCCD1D|nr:aspartate/glutamate racemase family protein [Kordia sp.]MCH2196621.1 aspartate/glutamate racemase family protein [Kordia sp.]